MNRADLARVGSADLRPEMTGGRKCFVSIFVTSASEVLSTFEPDIDPEAFSSVVVILKSDFRCHGNAKVVARLWRLTVPDGAAQTYPIFIGLAGKVRSF